MGETTSNIRDYILCLGRSRTRLDSRYIQWNVPQFIFEFRSFGEFSTYMIMFILINALLILIEDKCKLI